jgi:hypothetical protein
MSRLVGLYPAAWRHRYEAEFCDLLAERPPTLRDRLDIIRGALDARLHPQVVGPARVRDARGYWTFGGALALVAAMLIAANGALRHDEFGAYRDGGAALPLFVLACVLLSIGLYAVVERLPGEAVLPRAAGWTAIGTGPIWAMAPWLAPLGLVFLLGVLGLAVGARRAGLWPAWSVAVLVGLAAIPAGIFAAAPFLPWYAFRVAGLDFTLLVGLMGGMWVLVGGLLLRGQPAPMR